jgi:hypothetical protein
MRAAIPLVPLCEVMVYTERALFTFSNYIPFLRSSHTVHRMIQHYTAKHSYFAHELVLFSE